MGLFSSKKKTIVGLSVIDLGASKFDEYADFKRNAIMAADGHIDLYAKSLFDYKQRIRHSYSSSRLENRGMLPVPAECSLVYSPHILRALDSESYTHDAYGKHPISESYGCISPYLIEEREGYLDGYSSEDRPFREEIERWCLKGRTRQSESHYYMYDQQEGRYAGQTTYFYKEMSSYSTDYDDRYLVTVHNDIVSTGDSLTGHADTTIDHYWVEPVYVDTWYWRCDGDNEDTVVYSEDDVPDHPCGDGVSVNVSTGQEIDHYDQKSSNSRSIYNIKRVLFPRIKTLNINGNETSRYLLVGSDINTITNGIVDINTTYQSAPLLSVKELNEGKLVEADADATQEDRDAAFNQRKLFESFGQNVDQVSAYVDNGDIDDMKIGLILDLDSARENSSIARVAYQAINNICGNINTGIKDRNIVMDSSVISIETNYGNGVLTSSFSSVFSSGSNSSKYVGLAKYNVTALSDDTNLSKNIDDMIETYDLYYGEDAHVGLEPMVMRSNINNEYYASDSPSEELEKAFTDLPTIRDLIDIRDKKHLMVEHKRNDNTQSLISELNNADIKSIDGYTVQSVIRMSKELDTEYYVKKGIEVVYGDGFSGGSYVVYTIGKVTSSGSYSEYKIYGLFQSYAVDGHTFNNRPDTLDGTPFSIPVKEDIMNGLPFYEFMQTYDSLMNGLAFSVMTIKIKWYQQKWFAVVLIIILVIITVVIMITTAGAGTPIATQIMTFATNMVIAYAVTQAVMYVGEKLGVDPMVLDIVAFIASAIATGGLSALTQPTFYLQLADAALKAKLREQQEIAEQIKKDSEEFAKEVDEKSKLMVFEGTIIKDWAILENINVRSFYNSLGGNYIPLTVDQLSSAEEKKKYTLTPIVPMMTDGTAYLESQVGPDIGESDPTPAMSQTNKFGDTTYG